MPNIKFQLLDIGDDDVNFKYVVTLYGKYKDKNIVCHVNGFKPSFYVRVPILSLSKEDDLIEFKKIIEEALKLILTKEIISKYKDIDDEELEGALSKKMYFYTDKNCNYYCGMEYSDIIKALCPGGSITGAPRKVQ